MNKAYDTYLASVRKSLTGGKWSEYGSVEGFPLVVFETSSEKRTAVLSSGFHGDEPVGPLTFSEHGEFLLRFAKSRGVGLRIYPCTNPSGWSTGHRYSLTKQRPSNAVLEYLVEPGEWRGALDPGEGYLDWRLKPMPGETAAFVNHVTSKDSPASYLDIHQDGEIKRPGFYAYAFNKGPLAHLVKASKRFVPVLANTEVDESQRSGGAKFKTDELGLVTYHDGSTEDLLFRLGTKNSVALETTLATPTAQVLGVNLVWAMGMISLAAIRSEGT